MPQPLPPRRALDSNTFLSREYCRFCNNIGTQFLCVECEPNETPLGLLGGSRTTYISTCLSCQNTMDQRGYQNCSLCHHYYYTPSPNERYCTDCYTNLTCQDCGSWRPHDSLNRPRPAEVDGQNRRVCLPCLTLNYSHCFQCGDWYYPQETASRICLYCIQDNEERERERDYEDEIDEGDEDYRDVSIKVASETFKKNPHHRYVGFELEFIHRDSLIGIYKYGNIHDDGSIRMENGLSPAEFASSPTNGDNLLAVIKEVSKIINNAGGKVNTSCGFHVHLDMAMASDEERRNIRDWWKAYEKVMYSFVSESRRDNTYAKSVHSLRSNSWERDRYCSLNITAISKWATYEVRLHHGTTNAEKISDWIMFLLGFFDVFSKIPYTDTRKRKMKTMNEREMLIFLFQQIKFSLTLKKKFVRRVKEYGQYISFSKEKRVIAEEKLSTPEVIHDAFMDDTVYDRPTRVDWTRLVNPNNANSTIPINFWTNVLMTPTDEETV